MNEWLDAVQCITNKSAAASQWLVSYMSSDQGLKYIKPFLIECSARDVRTSFSQLVERCVSGGDRDTSASVNSDRDTSASVNTIVQHIVNMLRTDVAENVKHSSQCFWLLLKFAQMVKYFLKVIVFLIIFCIYREFLIVSSYLTWELLRSVFIF